MKTLGEANRVVVAVGGHAIARGQDLLSMDAIHETVNAVMDVCRSNQLAIVHGNGPQFGALEKKYVRALNIGRIKEMPSPHELILETQQGIGILIQGAVLNYLFHQTDNGEPIVLGRSAAVHNTHTAVDMSDSSFLDPVKGIGGWVEGNVQFALNGIPYTEHPTDKGKFREVVPSPDPKSILDIGTIHEMVEAGIVTICGGGGGIPVIGGGNEEFLYVPQKVVIDKDATAQLIADGVNADVFAIITNIPGFYAGYETDDPKLQNWMDPDIANWWIRQNGKVGSGSMNPKLIAARDFVLNNRDGLAMITDLEGLKKASKGDFSCSTVVSREPIVV